MTNKKITLLLLASVFTIQALTQTHVNKRAEWFVNARYGMFIHWGIYRGAEGFWKGEKLRNNNDYAEWIQYRNRIPKDEYLTLLNRFDWNNIDPEEWVRLAWQSGMKYVVLTSKHHDGFALWDSKVNDYNIGTYTNHKRDIVKEVSDACHKYGLKFGVYYSHWVDWEHPYGWDHTKEIYKITQKQYDEYWQNKVLPQMRELLTNYGKIDMIWFDMWFNHSRTIVSKEELIQLKKLIRKLQPECLVNSRLGLSIEEDPDVDYRTMGDNQLGRKKFDFPWQSPATVAHSWGYNAYEDKWKSTTTLLHSLINNVSLNGNLLLNIGPRANGDVPYEISLRLTEIGKWLAVNGESIYGSGAFDLPPSMHDWGKITYKQDDNGTSKVFLHVFNWPLEKKLYVTGIKNAPKRVYLLADKQKAPLKYNFSETVTSIDLSVPQPDPYVSVIVMEYDKKPDTENDLVAKSIYNGYSLTPYNFISAQGDKTIVKSHDFGSIPVHLTVKNKSSYTWRIYVEKPDTLNVDVSYGFEGENGKGKITVEVAGLNETKEVENTGLFVIEPGQNSRLENFKAFRFGTINITKPGYYDIKVSVEPAKNEKIDLLWVWIGK
ncbi:MAG: alpha-L-fucosidase [Chlorobi bacterium]|nr:alpha-L-fucosidase [Chlorobiota bacterium]